MLIAEKGIGDGYGICARESFSILDVVKILGCTPEWLPPKEGNRQHAVDMSFKTKELGWEQKCNLKSYLEGQLYDKN